jgi:hypothetical protein
MRIISSLLLSSVMVFSAGVASSQSSGIQGMQGPGFLPAPHLSIGDIYGFPDTTTYCLHKEDFDLLIAAIRSGKDDDAAFKAIETCDRRPPMEADTPTLPHMFLEKKINEVTMRDGRSYWIVKTRSLDGETVLYVALPAAWFIPENSP